MTCGDCRDRSFWVRNSGSLKRDLQSGELERMKRRSGVLSVVCRWGLVVVMLVAPCHGWFDTGHHLVGILAFDLLDGVQKETVGRILSAHPRFDEEFQVPSGIQRGGFRNRWLLGRASYWPDLIRGQEEWDRPTWHYQLGAALTVGQRINVPPTPQGLPNNVSLQTTGLHVAQAFQYCRSVLADKNRRDADRAIAICWLAHLAGDSHQPCHAGSLYYEGVFPEGDRGANWLKLKNGSNLHAFWDGQFGSDLNWAALDERAVQLRSTQAWKKTVVAAKNLDPMVWLQESVQFSRGAVYTDEVLAAVEATRRSGQDRVPPMDLSPRYRQRALEIAEQRVVLAARRLANVLQSDLAK